MVVILQTLCNIYITSIHSNSLHASITYVKHYSVNYYPIEICRTGSHGIHGHTSDITPFSFTVKTLHGVRNKRKSHKEVDLGSPNKTNSERKHMRYKNGKPASHVICHHLSSHRGGQITDTNNEGGNRSY